jgi:NAD(P)H-flavin reductase/hemoglobin-like flavoprotein
MPAQSKHIRSWPLRQFRARKAARPPDAGVPGPRVPTQLLAPGRRPPRATPPAGLPPVPPPPPPPALNPLAVRQSMEGMTAGPTLCAGDFYGYLFAACPHLREMFPPQMTVQNERLFAALLKMVSLLDTPDQLARYLARLGADHRKYGVRPEHYAPVGDALLRTLRRHCPAWGPAAEAAWQAAYAAASQMMIAGAAAAPGPATYSGQVVRRELRSHDLAVLHVRTDVPLAYRPGQYVTVESPTWPRSWRHFSVANMPAPGGSSDYIELHVRAVPCGWVSRALVRDAVPGTALTIGPAAGALGDASLRDHDLVMVAGGTGLAPVKAIVESVLAGDEAALLAGAGRRRNIHLFHGARTPMGLYDMPALHELSACYPWLQVIPVISGDPGFPGLTGNVADAALGFSEWEGREIFISGPAGMNQRAVSQFRAAGYPGSLLHFDDGIEGTG